MSRSSGAKKRWKLLSKAITNRTISDKEILDEECLSTQFHGLFGVLECQNSNSNPKAHVLEDNWTVYTCPSHRDFSLLVKRVNPTLSPSRLIGYNNTGNIRVWPSEEILAFYCLENKELFSGKRVLELGGGMTCLAAMAVAQCCECRSVCMSDGNPIAVENVQTLVKCNTFRTEDIETKVLDWMDSHPKLEDTYDIVLSADCLFFDEGRQQLVEMIFRLISVKGIALVMAPRRNNTLQDFVYLATEKFRVTVVEKYHPRVTELYEKYVEEMQDFNPDLHYPILIVLEKSSGP